MPYLWTFTHTIMTGFTCLGQLPFLSAPAEVPFPSSSLLLCFFHYALLSDIACPFRLEWKSLSSCPCMNLSQNCQNSSSCGPKRNSLNSKKKDVWERCLLYFDVLFLVYEKGKHKQKGGSFVLVWLDKSQPRSKLSFTFLLKLSLFASMTTFICYYKHVYQYRWLRYI